MQTGSLIQMRLSPQVVIYLHLVEAQCLGNLSSRLALLGPLWSPSSLP